MEELTWAFTDMTDSGGRIALMWDKDLATVAFQVEQGSRLNPPLGDSPNSPAIATHPARSF